MDNAPTEYVKDTAINGLHIAATVETLTLFDRNLPGSHDFIVTLQSVDPIRLAIMKNSLKF